MPAPLQPCERSVVELAAELARELPWWGRTEVVARNYLRVVRPECATLHEGAINLWLTLYA